MEDTKSGKQFPLVAAPGGAILGAFIGTPRLQRIEGIGGIANIVLRAPLGNHDDAMFNAIRTLYPVRTEPLAGFEYPWKGDSITY